jgi:hypothetical protein
MLSWLSKIKERAMDYKKNLSENTGRSDLDKAFREYEDWRSNRSNRGLIPEHLWETAVKLCRTYSLNQVVKTLHLNYNALRRRVESDFSSKDQSRKPHKKYKRRSGRNPRFIEVSASAAKNPFNPTFHNSIIIEYQKADGTNLKIHIPQGIELNLREILAFFSGERSS